VFKAETMDDNGRYSESPSISVHITVDVPHAVQRPVDKRAGSSGTFNFIAADYGEHVICVTASSNTDTWTNPHPVRFHLGFFYGDQQGYNAKNDQVLTGTLSLFF
jgi:hypothetical protein